MSVQHAHPVSLAEWDDHWSEVDEVRELVGGELVMVPSERFSNVYGASKLIIRLHDALGPGVVGLTNLEVLLRGDPRPTVRRPDLVVLGKPPLGDPYRVSPDDVLLIVEFLSPSTARTDLQTKVVEYADAQIPAYLMVDTRPSGHEIMTLLTQPSPGGYRTREQGVALSIPLGDRSLRLTLDDLRRPG